MDVTELQRTFLHLMAIQEIEYKMNLEVKITGIAKGLGIEFKKKR